MFFNLINLGKTNLKNFKYLIILLILFFFQGCTSSVEVAANIGKKYFVPKKKITLEPKPIYKIGKKYSIKNKYYFPKKNLYYDKTGIASWYGPKFHGKLTANGEIFNKNIISAAHRTLPMPSMVRVTNLNNGKVLNIRINDRGPYIHGRIIDLSEKAAELLGFKDLGIARVKVQVLMEQSLWLERSAKSGDFPVDNLKIRNNLLPEITPIIRPKVKIDQTSDNSNYNNEIIDNSIRNKKNSFTDLLAAGREGNLRQINPTETNIWIQIGAFSSRLNSKMPLMGHCRFLYCCVVILDS